VRDQSKLPEKKEEHEYKTEEEENDLANSEDKTDITAWESISKDASAARCAITRGSFEILHISRNVCITDIK
jgi:hypothetical protein